MDRALKAATDKWKSAAEAARKAKIASDCTVLCLFGPPFTGDNGCHRRMRLAVACSNSVRGSSSAAWKHFLSKKHSSRHSLINELACFARSVKAKKC